jgi:hypothetical protein
MNGIDLNSLQNDLAFIDLITPQKNKSSQQSMLGELLLKKDSVRIKIYQEIGHKMPHLHIDYGHQKHIASYAIDTGHMIKGSLNKKYDKAIFRWILNNKEQLNKIWVALQNGEYEHEYKQTLGAL